MTEPQGLTKSPLIIVYANMRPFSLQCFGCSLRNDPTSIGHDRGALSSDHHFVPVILPNGPAIYVSIFAHNSASRVWLSMQSLAYNVGSIDSILGELERDDVRWKDGPVKGVEIPGP